MLKVHGKASPKCFFQDGASGWQLRSVTYEELCGWLKKTQASQPRRAPTARAYGRVAGLWPRMTPLPALSLGWLRPFALRKRFRCFSAPSQHPSTLRGSAFYMRQHARPVPFVFVLGTIVRKGVPSSGECLGVGGSSAPERRTKGVADQDERRKVSY